MTHPLGRDSSGTSARPAMPGQIVLVLQGGGALGAYQAGVYQALHEAGIAPHWVIGTSIGAINAALIAGNPLERRLERLRLFWHSVEKVIPALLPGGPAANEGYVGSFDAIVRGVHGFFTPNPMAWLGATMPPGVQCASSYSTWPLHRRPYEEHRLHARSPARSMARRLRGHA